MAAANNDSQGLKIAVAAFVSLTVILAVTSYFLYSSYSQTDAKLTAAEQKAADSRQGRPRRPESIRGAAQADRHPGRRGIRSRQDRDRRPDQEGQRRDRRADRPGQRRRRQGAGGRGDQHRARDRQGDGAAARQQLPGRAEQDVHLVARPPEGPAPQPGDADHRAARRTISTSSGGWSRPTASTRASSTSPPTPPARARPTSRPSTPSTSKSARP